MEVGMVMSNEEGREKDERSNKLQAPWKRRQKRLVRRKKSRIVKIELGESNGESWYLSLFLNFFPLFKELLELDTLLVFFHLKRFLGFLQYVLNNVFERFLDIANFLPFLLYFIGIVEIFFSSC